MNIEANYTHTFYFKQPAALMQSVAFMQPGGLAIHFVFYLRIGSLFFSRI